MMTGDQFVARIEALRDEGALSDDQVAAACAGIVIKLCRANGEDPVEYMRWAVNASRGALMGPH